MPRKRNAHGRARRYRTRTGAVRIGVFQRQAHRHFPALSNHGEGDRSLSVCDPNNIGNLARRRNRRGIYFRDYIASLQSRLLGCRALDPGWHEYAFFDSKVLRQLRLHRLGLDPQDSAPPAHVGFGNIRNLKLGHLRNLKTESFWSHQGGLSDTDLHRYRLKVAVPTEQHLHLSTSRCLMYQANELFRPLYRLPGVIEHDITDFDPASGRWPIFLQLGYFHAPLFAELQNLGAVRVDLRNSYTQETAAASQHYGFRWFWSLRWNGLPTLQGCGSQQNCGQASRLQTGAETIQYFLHTNSYS